ncbi:MAG: AAA family ATP:ADP antiporter [Bacillariaceae sp.]|jgi:AAA family ATP:ADP antiporter
MPERDPFPMNSMEAKALEADIPSTASSNSWSSMPLETTTDGPSSADIRRDEEDGDSKSELVARKSSIRKDEQDDIYAHVDKEIVDEDDEENLDDPILDVPLEELRGNPWKRYKGQSKRALHKLYRRLYGDKLPPSEMLRTLCLAMTLFFMIGGYWLLRSLKDSVLMALCGVQAIPKAKMLSVFVVLGVVSVYNHLLDSDLAKHQLFYIFGTFYFVLFIIIALMLMNPTIGLANKYQDEGRVLGWVSYCAIESFGSVMVSLFWSFANSNITLETAKSSYGVMVAFAQLGSIIGPAIVTRYAATWGIAQCYMLGAMNMLLLQGTMYFYIRTYGSNEARERKEEISKNIADGGTGEIKPQKKKERAGILEGLVLFWKYNYVKGIFAISCLFMVEVTIVDFTLKVLAKEYFSEEYPCEMTNPDCYNADTQVFGLTEEASNAIASFMGLFGVATNSLSFIFSLLGTSAIIRKLGLRLTLLLFPSLCLIVIIIVRYRPTLYVVFLAMIMLKANSYALNNPTKEILYQPTSGAVRYKAKSWIDIFGARGSKALGSVVTNAFSDSAENLVANGSLVGMAVSCFLIWNARFMGKCFEEYTASGYIVGEENNPESQNIQMAIAQNENDDTSCALIDDDDDDDEEEEENHEDTEEKPKKKAEIALV